MKSKRKLEEEEDVTNETRNGQIKKDNINEAMKEAMNENLTMDMSHARFRISKYILYVHKFRVKP